MNVITHVVSWIIILDTLVLSTWKLQVCLFNISFLKIFRKRLCVSVYVCMCLCVCLWGRKGGEEWWNKIFLKENNTDTYINLFGAQIYSLIIYLFVIYS